MNGSTALVFSVQSTADLAMEAYYLDETQWHHILLGHRDLRSGIMAIQTTIESPTHVYKSSQGQARLLFLSDDVTTSKGHPMKVIVEREGARGKIITATWSSGGSGELVWDSTGNVYSNYDARNDIFYVSIGPAVEAYATDDPDLPAFWFRYDDADDSPVGVTVLGLRPLWEKQDAVVIDKIADFLGVAKGELRTRINAVLGV